AIDAEGNKWIATKEGLAMFDGESWTVYYGSLPSSYVTSIAIDAQGNKWIGTSRTVEDEEEGGVAVFDGENWTVYSSANLGLVDGTVTSIAIDEQGNKWIGTDKGLVKFDGESRTVYNLPSNDVTSIAIDAQGNKWIGTVESGLVMFD
ncbi:MAG: two-component regulator propeller domain-containing protein, partial [Candidatus Kryptonium sp.]